MSKKLSIFNVKLICIYISFNNNIIFIYTMEQIFLLIWTHLKQNALYFLYYKKFYLWAYHINFCLSSIQRMLFSIKYTFKRLIMIYYYGVFQNVSWWFFDFLNVFFWKLRYFDNLPLDFDILSNSSIKFVWYSFSDM